MNKRQKDALGLSLIIGTIFGVIGALSLMGIGFKPLPPGEMVAMLMVGFVLIASIATGAIYTAVSVFTSMFGFRVRPPED